MVWLYGARIADLPDPLENPETMVGLPEERIEKIKSIKRAIQRRQSLGAGLLLEYAKKQHLNLDKTYSNLSHSGEYVVCAISTEPVGCDLEEIKDAPLKVAERRFCEGEIEYLSNLNEDLRNAEFYRIWTIKESYMKMTGEGLGMGLGSFEVSLGEEITIKKEGKQVNCYIKEYPLDGYKISVCSEDNDYAEELLIVNI